MSVSRWGIWLDRCEDRSDCGVPVGVSGVGGPLMKRFSSIGEEGPRVYWTTASLCMGVMLTAVPPVRNWLASSSVMR